MIGSLGLAIGAVGALVVLAPRLPQMMGLLDSFWWFRELETAMARLYRDGHVDRGTEGFGHIASAVEYGSNWTNQPGERLERGGVNEIRLEIDGEVHHFEAEGYRLIEIEWVEDDEAYPMIDGLEDRRPPISQSIFELKYRPRVAETAGIPLLEKMSPYIVAQSPPGQLPRFIQDHKERLAFRLGAACCFQASSSNSSRRSLVNPQSASRRRGGSAKL